MRYFSNLAAALRGKSTAPVIHNHYTSQLPQPQQAGNGGEKFFNGVSGSGVDLTIDTHIMMMNARKAYHDSPHARAIIDTIADSTIGTGLKFESAIKFEELGISQEEAERTGSMIESKFDLWAKSKKQSRDGSMNFYQAQKLYLKSQIRDGEVFQRFYYNSQRDLLSPLQFSFVDPTQIQYSGYVSTSGPYNFDDGIKRNAQGVEIGYKIFVQAENGQYGIKSVEVPARLPGSGRLSMLHGFKAEYAGQKRGYSAIGHALQEFQDIQDYILSTLSKAAAQASIYAWQVPSDTADAINVMQDLADSGGVSVIEKISDQVTGTITSNGFVPSMCQVPGVNLDAKGAHYVGNLPAGSDIKFAPNSAPADNVKEFVGALMEYIAPSCKVPLEVLKMLWGTSFSASRATLLQFQEIKEEGRGEISADSLDQVLEAFVTEEVAAGRLQLPGFSDPHLKAFWLNGGWVGSGVPNIDPQKAVNAAKAALAIGLTNGKRAAKDYNQSNYSANVAKNTKDFEEMPIPYWEEDKESMSEIDNPDDKEEE
jgi:lambda family phage portal protein